MGQWPYLAVDLEAGQVNEDEAEDQDGHNDPDDETHGDPGLRERGWKTRVDVVART